MNVRVNGQPRDLPEGATIGDAVSVVVKAPAATRGVAVAVNGEVVARSRWNQVTLSEEDRVEILRAVGGG